MIRFSKDSAVRNSIIAGLATFTIAATVLMPLSSFAAAQDKVTICHAAGNGYITNQPNKTADAGGHDGHSNDIIPPFDYPAQGQTPAGSYPGKNWDANGQAIWNNGCVVPTPTPTPTPSDTPTPTPSDTPTPTPSDTPTPTPSDTPTPTPSNDPTPTPTPFNDPTPTPTPSDTPTPTPSDTPTPTPTPTPTHHHSGGGSAPIVDNSTPTPTPTPTETPVVLGASTQLPATGLSVTDALILALCAGIFTSGLVLTASSANRA